MATATATAVTRTGGRRPRADVVFTGGSESDRLTLADIATAHSSLSYDSETGRLTQSDSTPRTYRIGGSSETAAKDAFIVVPNGEIELHSNTGTDTSALDLGNETSKFIFDSQCDAVIGVDATGDPALDGRLTFKGENYSHDFFTYAAIMGRQAKVVCYGFIVLVGKGNSRFVVQNENEDSVIKLIANKFSHLDPYPSEVAFNLDPPAGETDVRYFGVDVQFRRNLTPTGTLLANEVTIPELIAEANDDNVELYFNHLDNVSNELTVDFLRVATLGTTTQPELRVIYDNGTDTVDLHLTRYRSGRGDAEFALGGLDGNITMDVSQDITVKLQAPDGTALTGLIRMTSATYSVTGYPANNQPTMTTDADGDIETQDSVSEHTFRVIDLVAAARQSAGAQNLSNSDRINRVRFTTVWWSAWVFGRELVVDRAVTLTAVGEREIVATLAVDPHVTSASDADVPSSAATFDDIYDLLHQYAVDNNEEVAGTVTNGVLEFEDDDPTLALGGSLSRSGSTVTIPCGATVAAGTKITGIKATGTLTINTGVAVTGPYQDTNGVAVVFDGLPHHSTEHSDHFNHHGVIRAWPQSQGVDDRSNAVTGEVADEDATSIVLTLAADTAYYYVADALGYRRSPVGTVDTTSQTSVMVSLEEIVDAQGTELIPHELTTAETAQAGLIEWAADRITVDADGTNDAVSYKAMVYVVEEGQSTAAACGSLLTPARIEVGRILFPSASDQKWRAKASLTDSTKVPDLQSTGIGKDGSADQEDFIDFSNGPVKAKVEAPVFATVEGANEDDVHGYLDNWNPQDSLTFPDMLMILCGVGIGRVEDNSSDDTKLDIYSAVDDSLVATVPKFDGGARAAGATTP